MPCHGSRRLFRHTEPAHFGKALSNSRVRRYVFDVLSRTLTRTVSVPVCRSVGFCTMLKNPTGVIKPHGGGLLAECNDPCSSEVLTRRSRQGWLLTIPPHPSLVRIP
jgi:hypothetical protein